MRSLMTLLEKLAFPEGPRWHDGRLFFSDMHAHRVMTVDLNGRSATICEVPHRPSGLGWLPDGRMLVVSMIDRRLMRLDRQGLALHADLGALASWDCNDMVVDAHGRAYVGNFGYDLHKNAPPKNAERTKPYASERAARSSTGSGPIRCPSPARSAAQIGGRSSS